ncbi:MAG: hypothetical protein US75_C0047G0002 [Candidatus Woesebacteria bacterium GW2011_GWC1_38_13]|uniref:Uncharacterized protein n=2 Tax=Candidatus Woeseibacteriota TaxID=1752722 RepID=A0A0G0KRY1_9BACT|nr:MAG: hypothetical protein US75_C0047G0002 [Candidatus Woesebacteria bacterium GW2011_GWC1_38_13]KKQ81572.1 MAG: hypothetical protein UT06_C0059G0006 [Candidatus Woesebacteria bacterium GW2011_GWA1_38_8]
MERCWCKTFQRMKVRAIGQIRGMTPDEINNRIEEYRQKNCVGCNGVNCSSKDGGEMLPDIQDAYQDKTLGELQMSVQGSSRIDRFYRRLERRAELVRGNR